MLGPAVVGVPVVVAAGLLLIAGAAKLRRPSPALPTLDALHLPAWPALVRALGAVEVAVGAGVLSGFLFTSFALALAALYLAFGVVVAAQLLRHGVSSSCGCFGTADVPPTPLHAILDFSIAAAAVGAAFERGAGMPHLVSSVSSSVAVVASAALAVAIYAAYLVVASLPLVGPPKNDLGVQAQQFVVAGTVRRRAIARALAATMEGGAE